MNYTTAKKTPRQLSREDFLWANNIDDQTHLRAATLGAQQRIADALERIAGAVSRIADRLDCGTTADAARALIRMEKRLAKRYPMNRRRQK